MSDFDAFELAAAFIIAVICVFQVLLFAFLALKRLGRRSRNDQSRSRRTADRPTSIRLQ